MKNIKHKLIAKLQNFDKKFIGVFRSPLTNERCFLTFTPFKLYDTDIKHNWSVSDEYRVGSFNIKEINYSSIHIYSYIGGNKVKGILSLNDLIEIRDLP